MNALLRENREVRGAGQDFLVREYREIMPGEWGGIRILRIFNAMPRTSGPTMGPLASHEVY